MSASPGQRATLTARADEIVREANGWLRSQLGPDSFEQSVSAVLMGSHARGELTEVSDIDYCVLFDCAQTAIAQLVPAELIRHLQEHVQSTFVDEPLARRFSVFWSCLRDLSGTPCHAGRLPTYDRGLLREQGHHLAGLEVPPASIRLPSQQEIGRAGVGFLLTEIRSHLAALGLFRPGVPISSADIQRFGPVLTTKVALMPVRMMYVLLPEAATRLFVSVEGAVRGCAAQYGRESWWPMAEKAIVWRESFPRDQSQLAEVASVLTEFARPLYQCCVEQHRAFAASHGLHTQARELADWLRELKSR